MYNSKYITFFFCFGNYKKMSTLWKEIAKKFFINWALGGLLLGTLAVIINFIKPELAGHLSGAIPFALTFTLISTYLLRMKSWLRK